MQSSLITSPKALLVELALGDDENVVSQSPRNALYGPQLVNPWDQRKGSPCHAQSATLWNAAKMAVRLVK